MNCSYKTSKRYTLDELKADNFKYVQDHKYKYSGDISIKTHHVICACGAEKDEKHGNWVTEKEATDTERGIKHCGGCDYWVQIVKTNQDIVNWAIENGIITVSSIVETELDVVNQKTLVYMHTLGTANSDAERLSRMNNAVLRLKQNIVQWDLNYQKYMKGKYIEYQYNMKEIFYGEYEAEHNACEVIATYNVLRSYDEDVSFPHMLAEFEIRGMVLNGTFGTSVL